MDIAAISSALGSVKAAIELTGGILRSSSSLEKAELKLKLSEIITLLSETNIKITQLNEIIQGKDQKIKELETSLINKSKVKKFGEAYFEITEEGKNIGDPYCMYCWENHFKLIHLMNNQGDRRKYCCPHCNNIVMSGRVSFPKDYFKK